jgi:CDP-diacylglycerol--glycerol-3-phosphate 3-phosphatidyltransferase
MSAADPAAPPAAWRRRLPTALTLLRIVAGPVCAALVLAADRLVYTSGREAAALCAAWAAGVFVLAALSDLLDGHLARRWGVVSALGAALDHAADKVLSLAAAVALAATLLPLDLVGVLLAILVRDAAVGGLREGLGGRAPGLAVGTLGKAKTVALLAGLALLLIGRWAAYAAAEVGLQLALLGAARGLLYAAVILALLSAARYSQSLWRKSS